MQNSPRNNTETVRAEVPDVISLYELAEQRDIDVYWYSMDSDLESLVAEIVPGHTAIAIDPFKLKSLGDEKYKLAHELGHSLTGSLYRRNTPLDERGRNEQRADGGTESVAQAGKHRFELGVFVVHLIYEYGFGHFAGVLPAKLGADLAAGFAVYYENGGIGNGKRLLDFAYEIEVARGVEYVYFFTVPNEIGKRS